MREAIAICQSLPGPLAIEVGIYRISVLRLLGVHGPLLSQGRLAHLRQRACDRPDRSAPARAPSWQSQCARFPRGRLCGRDRNLGACILLGKIAIGDWLTALIRILSLPILFRWKVSNALLIAATAVVGLIAHAILQPGWVMVHQKGHGDVKSAPGDYCRVGRLHDLGEYWRVRSIDGQGTASTRSQDSARRRARPNRSHGDRFEAATTVRCRAWQ